jgi:two-component system chemotaxis response regulator CheY
VSVTSSCLIVDDSDVVRKVMRTIIEGLGLDVQEAASVDEALSICRAKLPDLVVLDWHIPGSVPLELVQTLRASSLGQRVKILYVMTNFDGGELARARGAGISEHMGKPFRRVQLEAKVIGLLAKPRDEADTEIAPAPITATRRLRPSLARAIGQ